MQIIPSSRARPRAIVAGLFLVGLASNAIAQTAPAAKPASQRIYAQPQKDYSESLLTYVGVGAGTTRTGNACAAAGACDDSSLGMRLYAGGNFSKYVGLEVAYVNVGRPDASGGSRRAHGLGIGLVGNVPLGSAAEFNVRFGTVYTRSRNSGILASTYGASAKGFGMAVGAGVGFDLASNVQLRFDWDRYNLEVDGRDAHVDMLALGLRLKF